jgi:hypothetical protein
MVALIPPPDAHTLLPPVLACLPTAFASPRPPPALLPLLSPILRQRLSFLSSSDNWLKLLCWDSESAEQLWSQIEDTTFEPHPVSGEIEIGDVSGIGYKRFDEETLKAQLILSDWSFVPLFLWCSGGDDGDGWKLSDLLPSPTLDATWSSSIQEANSTSQERILKEALAEAEASQTKPQASSSNLEPPDDDEDYWAMYDRSPGRTPAPASVRNPSITAITQQNEADYYARYADVQPAMDNHDPDEEMNVQPNGIESTMNGHTQDHRMPSTSDPPPYQPQVKPNDPEQEPQIRTPPSEMEVQQPSPSSPSSHASRSAAIARLESAAEKYNDESYGSLSAGHELGVRQHISTTMKSMYRLARSVGMRRGEFEETISREVEGLKLLDLDGDD